MKDTRILGSVEICFGVVKERAAHRPECSKHELPCVLAENWPCISTHAENGHPLRYGIVWLPIDVNLNSAPDHDAINAIQDQMITSLDGGITPYNVLSNPFPNGITPAPQRNPSALQALYGQTALTQIPNNPLGYTQQWNFDIQRQLTGNSLLASISHEGVLIR